MTERTVAEIVTELKDRFNGINGSNAELIGTKGINRLTFAEAAPSEILDFHDLGQFKSARYAAEDLVGWVEDWNVDEQGILPLARELRDLLHDLEDESLEL